MSPSTEGDAGGNFGMAENFEASVDEVPQLYVDCLLGRRTDEILELYAHEIGRTILTRKNEERPMVLTLALKGELSRERLTKLQSFISEQILV